MPRRESNTSPESSRPDVFYANVMQAHGGAFDIAMDFANRVGDAEPEHQIRVFMSWTHLKLMVAVLQKQIEIYESQLGELPDLVADEEGIGERS